MVVANVVLQHRFRHLNNGVPTRHSQRRKRRRWDVLPAICQQRGRSHRNRPLALSGYVSRKRYMYELEKGHVTNGISSSDLLIFVIVGGLLFEALRMIVGLF